MKKNVNYYPGDKITLVMQKPDKGRIPILPSCYASALVNNDWSGLNIKEENELRNWLETAKPGGCIMVDGIEWFKWGHDMDPTEGATVTKFYFEKRH